MYEANVAFIEVENSKNNTYTLGVNQFAHLTNEEFVAQFTGGENGSALGLDDANLGELEIGDRAGSVDWSTNKGVVNPVKNQGQCGSCWAFSAVGTVESAVALASGKLGSYAEQQLVDCDHQSNGCSGGYNQLGMKYIGEAGLCSESGYPYKGKDGTCADQCSKELAAGVVTGYQAVKKSNAGLESALNTQPVSVTVHAGLSWQLYFGGILSHQCGLVQQPNHAVIAVGYDADSFKIRNSWGKLWGERGHVRLSKANSNPSCLYRQAPFIPTVSADVTV